MEDRSENSTLKESKSGNCADKAKGETVDTLDSAESFNSADSNIRRHKTLPRRTLQTAVGFPLIHAAAVAAKLHARTTAPAVPRHEEEHFTQQPTRIIRGGSARFIRVSLNNMRRILMNPVDR